MHNEPILLRRTLAMLLDVCHCYQRGIFTCQQLLSMGSCNVIFRIEGDLRAIVVPAERK